MVLKYPTRYASHGQYVTADNTGVPPGHSLVDVASTITVTEDWITNYNGGSRIIENKNFLSGASLIVQANNVTARYWKFNGVGRILIQNGATGFTFQDSEMDGQDLNLVDWYAIYPDTGSGITMLRVNIHNYPRALWLGYGNVYCEQCYFHALTRDGSMAHLENIYVAGGANQTWIRCKIVSDLSWTVTPSPSLVSTSASLAIYNESWASFPALSNIIVQDNYLDGEAGYGMYGGCLSGSTKEAPWPTNMTVTGNIFDRVYNRFCGVYDPATAFDDTGSGRSWTNNRWGARGPYWQAGDPEEGDLVACPGGW